MQRSVFSQDSELRKIKLIKFQTPFIAKTQNGCQQNGVRDSLDLRRYKGEDENEYGFTLRSG